jgi:glycosyltransferase involved in cell wall biosynthesis
VTVVGAITSYGRARRPPSTLGVSSTFARPRLLLLVQTLPFPPDGGVHIRTFHVIRLLSRMFDITALCFYRRAERPRPEDVAASLDGLRPFARVEAFPIPQEHDPARLVWDHLRSVATGNAYTWYAYDSDPVRRRVSALVAEERFDLVHIDSLDLACYLPLVRAIPTVCAHHNVESALMRRRASAERSRVRGAYLAHQAALLERLERRWSGGMALNVTVSPNDQRELERLAPGAAVVQVPNGVDVEAFHPTDDTGETGVVSVGGINWFPNRDALAYFSADILPRLRAIVPGASMSWVGRAEADERAEYRARYGVELTGYVEDIRPVVQSAACFVVPLRVGGGTRLKILDAWAMGKAVVSTSVGCEGLEAIDGENILIRDTPDGFAAAVADVLCDASLRVRLGCAGRATVERTYSWEVIGEGMLAAYAALLPGAFRAAGAS